MSTSTEVILHPRSFRPGGARPSRAKQPDQLKYQKGEPFKSVAEIIEACSRGEWIWIWGRGTHPSMVMSQQVIELHHAVMRGSVCRTIRNKTYPYVFRAYYQEGARKPWYARCDELPLRGKSESHRTWGVLLDACRAVVPAGARIQIDVRVEDGE